VGLMAFPRHSGEDFDAASSFRRVLPVVAYGFHAGVLLYLVLL